MIAFPQTLEAVAGLKGEFRAGGTDLQERRRSGISSGPLVDLRDLAELNLIDGVPRPAAPQASPSSPRDTGHGVLVGALTTVATLGADPRIRQHYPGLAEAAQDLATPEIRRVATVGGNLAQRSRCWYYRNPLYPCLKKGGDTCFARSGDHLYHSCFDLGPCVAPHPSTLGMAFLAYDAEVRVSTGLHRSMTRFLGDGIDPKREHTLEEAALITHVMLPAPWSGEQATYFRTTSRSRAEWPLVETLIRWRSSTVLEEVRVVLGGVATIPFRLPAVEAILVGKAPSAALFREAAEKAAEGARPLPGTQYKVGLVVETVMEALERTQKGNRS